MTGHHDRMKNGLHLLSTLLVLFAMLGAVTAKADSIIYSDNFSGSTLNPAWQVLPGQGTYSLNGDLRYYNQGPLSSPTVWDTTSLALALPFNGTNWVLDTEATYSLNWCTSGNYTGPSTPNQTCSSGAQDPQVIVSFAPVTASDRSALADSTNFADFSRGTDAWYGADYLSASYGGASVTNLLSPADSSITGNIAGGTYWYQFVRNGGMLTMSYSTDGINYNTALTVSLADPSNPFNELLFSGSTYLTVDSFTDYHDVTITALSSAPEPATWSLVLGGVLIFGPVAMRRRNFRRRLPD